MTNLPINNADDALKIGEYIARSGIFGVNTNEGGAIIALMCFQEGITLLEFQRTYHILEGGKPAMKADAMVAKFIELGGSYEIIERSKTKAAAKLWTEGKEPREFKLTIDEVKEAGYCFKGKSTELNRNWKQHPKNMLWARMMSDAIRALDPRVNAGTYTPEEEMDHHEDEATEPTPAEPKPKLDGLQPAQVSAPMPSVAPPKEKATRDEDDPFANMPDEKADNDIVPCGKNKGKRWAELSRETLEKVINTPGPLSKEQIECAKKALENTPF